MTNSNPLVTLTLLDFPADTPLEQWSFDRRVAIRLGRAADNDVVIDHELVSRYHVELLPGNFAQGEGWQVVNQGVNGTFLNDVLVSRAALPGEGLLQLAKEGPVLQFRIAALSSATSTGTASQNVSLGNDSGNKKCSHEGNAPTNLFCIHCGELLAPVQESIASYQVLRPLGQGGMGITYLAVEPLATDRGSTLLVLKEMNADLAEVPKAQELFTREARILQGLDHPGIPKYYASLMEQDKKYLAMELIHGEDLEARVVRSGAVGMSQSIAWMQQTCQILHYLHSQTPPLIHRDIKPANLMVRHVDNQVVLLDFGAVKEIGTTLKTRIGAEGGYSAPEQNQGNPCPQSDLYALGVTLIFLLTGKSPLNFYFKLDDIDGFDLQNIPTISPQLRDLINHLTQVQPSDRPQTALEVAQVLEQCLP
jgi:serine/threonine protein kinase, bacterial